VTGVQTCALPIFRKTVTVHVRGPDRLRLRAGGKSPRREKGPGTRSALVEDVDGAVVAARIRGRGHDVRLAVAVQVGDGDRWGAGAAGREQGRREELPWVGGILEQDDGVAAGARVGANQVRVSIEIHVGDHDLVRTP